MVFNPEEQPAAETPPPSENALSLERLKHEYMTVAGEALRTIEILDPGSLHKIGDGTKRIMDNWKRINQAMERLAESNPNQFLLTERAGESEKNLKALSGRWWIAPWPFPLRINLP